jgi:hypothetical protein
MDGVGLGCDGKSSDDGHSDGGNDGVGEEHNVVGVELKWLGSEDLEAES